MAAALRKIQQRRVCPRTSPRNAKWTQKTQGPAPRCQFTPDRKNWRSSSQNDGLENRPLRKKPFLNRRAAGFDTSRIWSRGRVPSVRDTWVADHHHRYCRSRNSTEPFNRCWNRRSRRFDVINDSLRLLDCLILPLCHNAFAVGVSERGGAERQAQYRSHAQNTTQAGEPVCCFHEETCSSFRVCAILF